MIDQQLEPRHATAIVRERNTAAVTTTMLSDAGRADRDRLLIASGLSLVVALPGVIDKVAVGPLEVSGIPVVALRIGILVTLFYFSLSFASQAGMDFMRWRADLRLALIEMLPRLDLHNTALNRRAREATERLERLHFRIAAHRAVVDPLSAELIEIMSLLTPNRERVRALELQIEAANEKLADENARDDVPTDDAGDYLAVIRVGRRVHTLRALMWINVGVTITMPLAIAAVAAGPVTWMLWPR